MPIRPKFRFDTPPESAQRYFTDREEPRAVFLKHVNDCLIDKHTVVNYYGIGGVGKSRLISELRNELKLIEGWVPVILDFSQPNLHDSAAALLELRNRLSKSLPKCRFRSFDFVYALYWQKLNPSIDLSNKSFELLENSDLLTDIGLGLFDTLEAVPGLGIVNKIAKLGKKANSAINDWWLKRGCVITRELEDQQVSVVKQWLPAYFAQDLHDYWAEYPQKRVCIFFDTYEALWENTVSEGRFFEVDDWIRELVGHLPEAMFVISGREKLRWSELDSEWNSVIDSHILNRLSDKDSWLFLERCGVKDNALIIAIASATEGWPFYLDLAVDSYRKSLMSGITPVAEDFMGKTPRQLLDRFVRYLDRNEFSALSVLAVCRSYDQRLFSTLMKEFETGYSPVNLKEFNRYSFVHHINENTFTIATLMKKSVADNLSEHTKIEVKTFLYHYFRNKVSDLALEGYENFSNFENARYYANGLTLSNEKLVDLHMLGGRVFQYQSRMEEALIEYEKAVALADSNLAEVQIIRIAIATTQRQFGDEEAACKTIENILNDCRAEHSKEIESKALVQLGLCYFSMSQTKNKLEFLKESIDCYLRGIELSEQVGNIQQILYAKISLSTALECIGQIDEAIDLLNQSKALAKTHNLEHLYIDCLNGLARKYLVLGEFNQSIALAEEGLELWRMSKFKRGQLVMCCHLLEAHYKLGDSLESVINILHEGESLNKDITEKLLNQMFEKAKQYWH